MPHAIAKVHMVRSLVLVGGRVRQAVRQAYSRGRTPPLQTSGASASGRFTHTLTHSTDYGPEQRTLPEPDLQACSSATSEPRHCARTPPAATRRRFLRG